MGKHHHNPHEGHRSGVPSGGKPLHHDWRFYAAGIFILIALLAFIFSGNLAWRPAPSPAPPPPVAGAR
jgi:hypothetical protein